MKITERQLRKVIRLIITEDAVINDGQNLINEGQTTEAIKAALLAAGIAFSGSQLVNFVKNLNDSQVTSNYSGDSLRAAHHAGELDDDIKNMKTADLNRNVANFVPRQGNTMSGDSVAGRKIQDKLKKAAKEKGTFDTAQMYSMD